MTIRPVYLLTTTSGLTQAQYARDDAGAWFVRIRKTRTRKGVTGVKTSAWFTYRVGALPPLELCETVDIDVRLPGEDS